MSTSPPPTVSMSNSPPLTEEALLAASAYFLVEEPTTPQTSIQQNTEPLTDAAKCSSSFRCRGRTSTDKACRKRIGGQTHERGMVCPHHSETSSFVQCSNGCSSYIHVGCYDKNREVVSNAIWQCDSCPETPPQPTPELETSGPDGMFSKEQEQDLGDATTDHNLPMRYVDERTAHDAFRNAHFVTKNSYVNAAGAKCRIRWECTTCKVRLSSFKCRDSEEWHAQSSQHLESCCHHVSAEDVAAEAAEFQSSKHCRFHHDFSRWPSLLEFIETMGASGEVRSDQLARAIAKHFKGCIVEANLLFRTAKKANETMFGSNPCDIMALQLLANNIESEGGQLRFIFGKPPLMYITHVLLHICFQAETLASLATKPINMSH